MLSLVGTHDLIHIKILGASLFFLSWTTQLEPHKNTVILKMIATSSV